MNKNCIFIVISSLFLSLTGCNNSTHNDIQNDDNNLSNEEIDIDETYNFIKEESYGRLVLKSTNKTNTAYSSYKASYTEKGIIFNVEFCDNDLYAKNIYDIGYDDNIEFIIGTKTNNTSWVKGKTFHFLINGSGKTFFQVASSGNTFSKSYSTDLHVVLGENLNYTFNLCNVKDNGFNGFKSEIFFTYDVLNTTYEEAYDNMSICPAMRNTHIYSQDTNWTPYSNMGCNWSNPSSFISINEDGGFGAKKIFNYDKLIIGDSNLSQSAWTTFSNDFKDLDIINMVTPESNISYWNNKLNEMNECSVKNLIISLGDNDLEDNNVTTTITSLTNLMSYARSIYENVNIYLVSLIYNPRNEAYIEKINEYNLKLNELANTYSYVSYIDITHLNDKNSYNVGYYTTNNALNYLAFNYIADMFKKTFNVNTSNFPKEFGNNSEFYSSYGFKTSSFNGNLAVEGTGDKDQYLIFSKESSVNVTTSIDINAKEIYNNDAYPKFGLCLLSKTDTLFFYIDGSNNLTTQKVGYVKGKNHSDWQWANSTEKTVEISYSNMNSTTLSISKNNNNVVMSVNGTEVMTNSTIFNNEDKVSVGILSFNTHTFISNYSIN